VKHSLLFAFLLICNMAFLQTTTAKTPGDLQQSLNRIGKHDCVLLYYNERFATPEQKQQAEEISFLSGLDLYTLDSLFFTEKNEIKVQLFFVMCNKYRSAISKEHLALLDKKQKIRVCDGGSDVREVALKDLSQVLYENSVERKESIKDPRAKKLLQEANELNYNGPVDFRKMIALLDEADSLEPQNPIILSERGRAKLNSKLDVDGAFADFNHAIGYSLDQKMLEIRYHNLGLSYMELGDITAACENWHKAGNNAQRYIEQYCDQPFDTVIRNNTDSTLVLLLKLDQPTARITSSHNSPEMSSCNARLTLRNTAYQQLTIVGNNLDYGLENSNSALYLEAISEDGKKFCFFTEIDSHIYSGDNDTKLSAGEVYNQEVDLTFVHQFPYAGTYKVRVVLRPSKNVKGLEQTVYSNWETLVIVKDYQSEKEGF
jgi:hypothetical protein